MRAAGRLAYAFRVALLLGVLAVVVLYAVHDVTSRRERTTWRRTLDVALVIVLEPGVETAAVGALRRRVPELAALLGRELHRYRPDAPRPFDFVTYGPTDLEVPLPTARGEGVADAARYAWDLYRFTRDVDHRATVPSRGFDARLYLVLKRGTEQALVEGMSEHGGRVGIARAELDADSVDVALSVAAHELFHTLGAVDHYGPDGRALVPDGLVDPEQRPPYPQQRVEIMARNRPVSATGEARLESLAELGVGPSTARELSWLASP
jgi:hypothetical protein